MTLLHRPLEAPVAMPRNTEHEARPGLLRRMLASFGQKPSGQSGYRGYRQEGFPEHELQQIISGHRDRFNNYLG